MTLNRKNPPSRWFTKVSWGGSLGEDQQCVYLPPSVLKLLKLVPEKTVILKAGAFQTPVRILQLSSNSHTEAIIFVSPDLANIIGLSSNQTMTLVYDTKTSLLSVGPLIGLFTVRNIFPDSEYGSQEPVLLALANSANELGGIVFIFCPEDIQWENSTVTGYVPQKNTEDGSSRWSEIKLPLPDVVYDRIPSRSIEARPDVFESITRLKNSGLKYFNPMFLDKWKTHLALQDISEVKGYLPPTALVDSPQDIKEFLDNYRSVFLKPSAGSLGKRIVKIDASKKGYSYIYRSRDKLSVQGNAPDFDSLMNQLRNIMGKRRFIVQKDLNLSLFENSTFDIRVLAQKDMFGNWRRTKIYVRVAAPDSFLSNLSDGARPQPINTVLTEVFNTSFSDKEGLGENIRSAVRKIPPALENATGMIWGELGIDLGIDKEGRIWLIEVNSKPFRALVSNSGSINLIRRSLLRPLEFAKFLAGFYKHSPASENPVPN